MHGGGMIQLGLIFLTADYVCGGGGGGCGCWGKGSVYIQAKAPITGWYHLSKRYNFTYERTILLPHDRRVLYRLTYVESGGFWLITEIKDTTTRHITSTRLGDHINALCPGECLCRKISVQVEGGTVCWAVSGHYTRRDLTTQHPMASLALALQSTTSGRDLGTSAHQSKPQISPLTLEHYSGTLGHRSHTYISPTSESQGRENSRVTSDAHIPISVTSHDSQTTTGTSHSIGTSHTTTGTSHNTQTSTETSHNSQTSKRTSHNTQTTTGTSHNSQTSKGTSHNSQTSTRTSHNSQTFTETSHNSQTSTGTSHNSQTSTETSHNSQTSTVTSHNSLTTTPTETNTLTPSPHNTHTTTNLSHDSHTATQSSEANSSPAQNSDTRISPHNPSTSTTSPQNTHTATKITQINNPPRAVTPQKTSNNSATAKTPNNPAAASPTSLPVYSAIRASGRHLTARQKSNCLLSRLARCLKREAGTAGTGEAEDSTGAEKRPGCWAYGMVLSPGERPAPMQYDMNVTHYEVPYSLSQTPEGDFWWIERGEWVYGASSEGGPCPDQLPQGTQWHLLGKADDTEIGAPLTITCVDSP